MNGNSHAMSPTLSVVLPNYNHAKFVGRALAALLGQERAADEIIVIDDGSTDDSVAVIERIAAAAPTIRLLRNPSNIGVIPTLQRGLEAARGNIHLFRSVRRLGFPRLFRSGAAPARGRSRHRPVLRRSNVDRRPYQPAVRRAAGGAATAARGTDRCRRHGSVAALDRQLDPHRERDLSPRLRQLGRRLRCTARLVRRRLYRAQGGAEVWLPVRAGNRRQLGGVPRQRLAQDRARPATHEIHSRRCSDPDRRRSRLPAPGTRTRSATAGDLPRAAWRSRPIRSSGRFSSSWARQPLPRRPNWS